MSSSCSGRSRAPVRPTMSQRHRRRALGATSVRPPRVWQTRCGPQGSLACLKQAFAWAPDRIQRLWFVERPALILRSAVFLSFFSTSNCTSHELRHVLWAGCPSTFGESCRPVRFLCFCYAGSACAGLQSSGSGCQSLETNGKRHNTIMSLGQISYQSTSSSRRETASTLAKPCCY